MEHDPAVIAGVSLAIETVIAKAVELSPELRVGYSDFTRSILKFIAPNRQ